MWWSMYETFSPLRIARSTCARISFSTSSRFGLCASMSLRVPKKWPHSSTSDGTSFAGRTGPHLYGTHSELRQTCTPTLTSGAS